MKINGQKSTLDFVLLLLPSSCPAPSLYPFPLASPPPTLFGFVMSDVLLPVLIDGAGWQHRRGHAGYAAAAGAAAAGAVARNMAMLSMVAG